MAVEKHLNKALQLTAKSGVLLRYALLLASTEFDRSAISCSIGVNFNREAKGNVYFTGSDTEF